MPLKSKSGSGKCCVMNQNTTCELFGCLPVLLEAVIWSPESFVISSFHVGRLTLPGVSQMHRGGTRRCVGCFEEGLLFIGRWLARYYDLQCKPNGNWHWLRSAHTGCHGLLEEVWGRGLFANHIAVCIGLTWTKSSIITRD